MTGQELLQLIAIGAIAGAFGQGLRVTVGIKKAGDEAAVEGTTLSAKGLDVSRLTISIFIGTIAGGIGIFTITGFSEGPGSKISAEMFFGVVGIGYAGTDFIEGFIRTRLPRAEIFPQVSNVSQQMQYSSGFFKQVSTSERIKQSCERLLQIQANAADCSGFAKAVSQEFAVTLTGQANDIVEQLTSANGWTELGSDEKAGQRAAAAAAKGELVIGAQQEAGNGHIVVVVEGFPLAHDLYPFAYWGKLNDPANAGFNKTVNWAWDKASRDSVTYASRRVV